MNTQPPHPPGSPEPQPPSGELEAVRAALAPDYEVQQELGRGGMAVVYRAREVALDREVAIKVLPASLGIDKDFVERFEREARTAGQLEHPNIVPIYRVGRAGPDGRIIYFVMKMLRGQSLSAVLRGRGRLAVEEVRRIMKETAAALGFAGKKGVVHRDVKPDNILLDDEGRCVVTDFGIAKTSTGPHTAAGTSMGTPRYMSPEHAQGTPVDVRSDIYSLGVVAYQCLTGVTPFDADNPFAILYKHINETLPRPSLTTPEEWALYAVIEKCLNKKAIDRYQTTDDLLSALGAEITGPNTLTAAMPQRISSMVATEVITSTLPSPWYKQYEVYHKLEMYGKPYGVKPWHLAAMVAAVFVIGSALAMVGGPENPAKADSIRLAAGGGPPAAATPATGATTSVAGVTQLNTTANVLAPTIGASGSTGATGALTRPPDTLATRAKVAAATPPRPRREAFSKCPATGSAALTKMASAPVLLVDSIPTKLKGDTLVVSYDMCGLKAGTAFTAVVVLKHRRRLGGDSEVSQHVPDVATGPRTRRQRTFALTAASAGSHTIEVRVRDASDRAYQVRRDFQISERPTKSPQKQP